MITYVAPLQGTEKQIAWGKDIRSNKLIKIGLLPTSVQPVDMVYRQARLRAISQASWWINRRNVEPLQMVKDMDMRPTWRKCTNFKSQAVVFTWLQNLKNFVILDTETTGLGEDAEIVELAVIDSTGKPLMNTLIKPSVHIPEEATGVNGITDEMVQDAPSFHDVWPTLYALLCELKVIVYNASYDMGIIKNLAKKERYTGDKLMADCAMQAYAAYKGEMDTYGRGFKWHRLEVVVQDLGITVPGTAHRALADCMTTLLVLQELKRVVEETQTTHVYEYA